MDNVVKIENRPSEVHARKQVAAYARVSNGKDAMLHSLAAQVAYYSNAIKKNPEWEYAGVYADGCVKIGLNRAKPCGTRDCAGLVLFLHYHIRRPK